MADGLIDFICLLLHYFKHTTLHSVHYLRLHLCSVFQFLFQNWLKDFANTLNETLLVIIRLSLEVLRNLITLRGDHVLLIFNTSCEINFIRCAQRANSIYLSRDLRNLWNINSTNYPSLLCLSFNVLASLLSVQVCPLQTLDSFFIRARSHKSRSLNSWCSTCNPIGSTLLQQFFG